MKRSSDSLSALSTTVILCRVQTSFINEGYTNNYHHDSQDYNLMPIRNKKMLKEFAWPKNWTMTFKSDSKNDTIIGFKIN